MTDSSLSSLFRLNPIQKAALKRLAITSASDLLYYLPARYEAPGIIRRIAELESGEETVVFGKVTFADTRKAWTTKRPMGEITLEDQTGTIKATWFNQPYLAKKVPVGSWAKLRGKIVKRKDELCMSNPDIELVSEKQAHTETLFQAATETGDNNVWTGPAPVYPETRGLSSGWFHYHIRTVIGKGLHLSLPDPIPEAILKKYNLPSLATALVWIHTPQKENDAIAARKRFAFQEIFLIQLRRLKDKEEYQKNKPFKVDVKKSDVQEFLGRFPFKATEAQERAIATIINDLDSDRPMTRLVEGDVGSGKTAVAATVAFAAVKAGFEVAYMAPTEILAKQHFESFIQYFAHMGLQVGLITGSECRKFPSKVDPHGHTHISRSQLLKWVAEGQIPILVGTHALIQKSVKFKNLALAIIDEQHRFGVMQRNKLVTKDDKLNRVPHLLSMTATPIPRTLALTIYGDLDLSVLDQMPAGRKPIITDIVPEARREEAYEKIRSELKAGRQAYVICPRIDEPDPTKEMALLAKSAKAEAERLQKSVFKEFRLGLLHGKMKPGEKEDIMQEFSSGDIDILVATSVVEVGVNVPNATLIMIEGAERFGLAQLHQLRGRVVRSSHQAYCFAMSDTKNKKSFERLNALKTAKNGFELAELDLMLRGAGQLSAGKQWGVTDIGMEALRNLRMVEAARAEAQSLLKTDAALKRYPLLLAELNKRQAEVHFE
ncbi:MAG TPA: ATP-dependent DNA helicase RecG [Candidatus Paceibacterota bacterium]|nr:ATP-dependent DNA helicase RecG [Candidatus Paceibacterota bacterium]